MFQRNGFLDYAWESGCTSGVPSKSSPACRLGKGPSSMIFRQYGIFRESAFSEENRPSLAYATVLERLRRGPEYFWPGRDPQVYSRICGIFPDVPDPFLKPGLLPSDLTPFPPRPTLTQLSKTPGPVWQEDRKQRLQEAEEEESRARHDINIMTLIRLIE